MDLYACKIPLAINIVQLVFSYPLYAPDLNMYYSNIIQKWNEWQLDNTTRKCFYSFLFPRSFKHTCVATGSRPISTYFMSFTSEFMHCKFFESIRVIWNCYRPGCSRNPVLRWTFFNILMFDNRSDKVISTFILQQYNHWVLCSHFTEKLLS